MYIRGKTFAEKHAEKVKISEKRKETGKQKPEQKLTAAQRRKVEQYRQRIAAGEQNKQSMPKDAECR